MTPLDPHRVPPTNPPEPDGKECCKALETGPTSQNVEPKQTKQTPEDLVEEELMESFPASDPPSHTKSHT